MIVRSRCLESLCFGVALLAARAAHADPSPVEISSARQAFESAVSLETAHHWAEAALKLREALAVKDTPGLRFHLAHCEVEQGLLVEAALDYERASSLIAQGAKAPDVRKLLTPASAALELRIPRVTVSVPSDLLAPVATVDGKVYPASEIELGVSLNPGQHQLTVSANGRLSFQRSFALKEGQLLDIQADLPPVPAPAASVGSGATRAPQDAPTATATRGEPDAVHHSAKPYLLVGESVLTAAGLVVGFVSLAAAASAKDRVGTNQARIDEANPGVISACSSGDSSPQGACADLRQAVSDHDRAVTWTGIGFVVAGVGAAALLTTWLVYPSSHGENVGVRVQPVLGFGRVGVTGSF